MVVSNIVEPAIDHGFWKRGPVYRLQDGMPRYLTLEVTDGNKWETVQMPWNHDDRDDFMSQMFFVSLPPEKIKDTVRLLAEIFCNKENWELDGPDCLRYPHQWESSKKDFENVDIEAYKEAVESAGGEHEQEVYAILTTPERMSKICWSMIDLLAKTYIAALCEDEEEDEEEEEEEEHEEQTDPQEMMVCDPDPC